MSGFGDYCSDLENAQEEFNELIKNDSNSKFKLKRYDAVIIDNKIIGITGEPIIIAEYPK